MKRILLVILMSSIANAIMISTTNDVCNFVAAAKRMYCSLKDFASGFPSFAPGSDIVHLEIIECNVQSIPANAFENVTKLKEIRITKNENLTEVDDQAFNGLTALLKLELSNKASTATSKSINLTAILKSLESLNDLSIINLKVQALTQMISSVQRMTLENTNLPAISDNAFERSTSIEDLLIKEANLAGNLKWLRYLTKLKRLRLASARLQNFSLPDTVVSLRELDLNRNEIRDLSSSSLGGSVKTLTTLYLDNTKVLDTTLNSNLNSLTALTTLSLRFCGLLVKIPSFINKLPELKILNIDESKIEEISANTFPSSGKLQQLSMSQSKFLRTIHSQAFLELKNLYLLTMSQTNFQSLTVFSGTEIGKWSDIFNKTSNLSALRLIDCQLDDAFWNDLEPLTKLQNIELSNNGFTKIKDFAFSRFSSLKTVSINSNSISKLTPQSTYGILKTTTFNLKNNNISKIDNCTFANLDVNKVYLDMNPLVCDCHLKWLREAMNNTLTSSSPSCGPGPNVGKKLMNLLPRDFTCTGDANISNCVLIPYTTPLPPAPAATIVIDQKTNVLSIKNGEELRRWYSHYYVTYSDKDGKSSFNSKVYLITASTAPLDRMVAGNNYTVCLKFYKYTGKVAIVDVSSLPSNDLKGSACMIFAAIAVAKANIGAIIGGVVGGLAVVCLLIVLVVCCYKRRLKSRNSKYSKSEEGIYEDYVYPPSSDVYSTAPVASRPASRRFVRASDVSRAGTQSTVLSSTAPTSRLDLAQSTISLAVQNSVNPRQRSNPDPRRFVSMGNLPTNSVISSKPGVSMSMDELNRRNQYGNRPLQPRVASTDTALANRALPDPHAEDYEYIEDREQYYSPEDEKYLDMKPADTHPSQYVSMSSANSLEDVIEEPSSPGPNETFSGEDNYAVDFNPPVPPRPPLQNGTTGRPKTSRESQVGLVNRNSSDSQDSGYHNQALHLSSADIGNF